MNYTCVVASVFLLILTLLVSLSPYINIRDDLIAIDHFKIALLITHWLPQQKEPPDEPVVFEPVPDESSFLAPEAPIEPAPAPAPPEFTW
jgi:hypothetical protein